MRADFIALRRALERLRGLRASGRDLAIVGVVVRDEHDDLMIVNSTDARAVSKPTNVVPLPTARAVRAAFRREVLALMMEKQE